MNTINNDERLSPHFTLREMIVSGTAIRHNIDNTPSAVHVERLKALCQNVLEPLRRRFGVIRVTSGYCCSALNAKVGGAPDSQHLRGEAADIHVSSREVAGKMFAYIRDNLPFDQLLFERRSGNGVCWLHVSHKADLANNRRDCGGMVV